MTRQELRDAIKRPAEKLKIQVGGELIERILGTVGKEPGYLPLLEFALTLLWKKQQESELTLTAYEEIGGVEQSLAAYADEVYRGLREEKQRQAQQIFVQLVQPGEGTEDTRRVATRVEIGEENWNLVVHLADARLIVSGRDEAVGVETVEIVHEALIGGWRRLHEWIETHRVFRIWQERLRAAIRQWEGSGRDEGALLRGVLLTEAEGWMAQRLDMITPAEQAFIQVSREGQKAEEQRISKLIDEFLAATFLDLRTPLSAISGYSTLLKRQSSRIDAEHILRFTDKIAAAAQQMIDLVSNMIEAAKIGTGNGKLDLQIGPAQLLDAVGLASSRLSVNIEQKIVSRVASDLWVKADPLPMRQVISNLLDNAAKYSPSNSCIEILAEATLLSEVPLPDDQIDVKSDLGLPVVLVRVSDTGEGILPGDQQKIFEKFVRAPRSLQSPVRGSGLGLYICRRYIEAMGGRLWLEHSTPDVGSTFSFYLVRQGEPIERDAEGDYLS
jgi:signal transduction histidine kinase